MNLSGADLCPYKGLAPFEDSELDARFFFGRDREREIITANLMASRLTVLYGETGVGKSSVLRAGVVHHLRSPPEPLAVVVFDAWRDDPVEGLERAVADAAGAEPAGSLADTLELCAARLGGELYVILDQAEEYFLYHASERGPGTFLDEFSEAVTRPGLRTSFLLSLREDSLAKLDRFKGRIPNLFSNYLRLEHLDRAAAREAIVGPIEQYNRLLGDGRIEIEPALVESVLDEVAAGKVDLGQAGRGAVEGADATGRVETPYLQLVMERLWEAERSAGSQTLRLATLRKLGGAEQIVRDHLEGALDALTPLEKDVAAAVFNHLVTPSGTKIAHGVADLAGYAHVNEPELVPVLSALSRERIVRPVAAADGSDAPRYEIYHDVLADAVLAWRSGHDTQKELERQKTEAEKRHRRLLVVAGAALFALAVMAGVTVFALTQRSEARRQARLAHARELAAIAASQLQVDPQFGLVLAVEAARLRPTSQAEDVLRQALIESRLREILPSREAVTAASFSPDGKLVLSASMDGTVRVWNAADGEPVRTLRHGDRVMAAAFSPGGKLVVTAGADGTARIWQVGAWKLLHVLRDGGPVTAASFSSDGRLVLATSADGTARIWRVDTGAPVRVIRSRGTVTAASFSPDGRLVVTVSGDRFRRDLRARIYDVATGRLLHELDETGIRSVSFSPSGRLLVTGSADRTAGIWSVRTGRALRTLADHQGAVTDASFGPGGKLVVTTSEDGATRVWDAKTGTRLAVMLGHTNIVNSASFSPDGKWLVTASQDGTARIWEAETGRPQGVLRGHRDAVGAASFSPDGRLVVTASDDGTARVWDPVTEPRLMLLGEDRGPVRSASFSPDGRLVVTASDDGTARVLRTGGGLLHVLAHRGPVTAASFSPDGSLILTASRDGTARIWEASGAVLRTLRHGGPVVAASFSSDGALVLTGGEDGRARVWRARTGAPLQTLSQGARVTAAAFSPDGKLVITAGDDGTARLWDVGSGSLRHVLRGHQGAVVAAAFSPDGGLAVTAGEDRTARIWDLETGRLLHALRGHADALTDATFSPDGRVVLTASRDHDVRAWDVATGRVARLFRGHFGPVFGASFSPDGRWVVTAGPITAGLWRADTGRLLFYLRGHREALTDASFSPDGKRILTASRDGTTRIFSCEVCGGIDDLLAVAGARLARVARPLTPAQRQRYLHD